MSHPFENKLFVFIGNPTRCSRQAARDALNAVGGVADERITTFTHYIVAFNGADRTKVFQKAIKHDEYGHMIMLNEGQFFDVLEGKAEPHKKKTSPSFPGVTVYPAKNPEAIAEENDRVAQYVIAKKRLKNMARHGVPTSDGGRMKVDFRLADIVNQLIKDQTDATAILGSDSFDRCNNCGKPSSVHIGAGAGNDVAKLCLDCYNILMAELTGTEMPASIPRRLSFNNSEGETRDFAVEFQIYHTGKSLTATEIGATKRRADVHGELEDDFNVMLETLSARIIKELSVTYMKPDGYFSEDKAVGYIEYNRGRKACDIIIDGKPYSWAELEKNISSREGWKIKIEFGDVGDEL